MAQYVTPRLVLLLVSVYTVFDTTQGAYCPTSQLLNCFGPFDNYIGWKSDVVRLSDAEITELCTDSQRNINCARDKINTCQTPMELNGLLPAYQLLCSEFTNATSAFNRDKGYRTCFRNINDQLDCTVVYPQVMPMAARHITNKADEFLDMSYSESAEFKIFNGICVHLSISRDIFCSDSILRMKCGVDAAQWHTNFAKLLFNLTFESLPDVTYRGLASSLNRINLRDCSSVGDDKAKAACQLSEKCVPVLNNFAKNVRFGVFTFTDSDLQSFCGLSKEELENCVSKIVPHCSFIDVLIFNGSLKVHEKLCSDPYKTQYADHKECRERVVAESNFGTVVACTDELSTKHKDVAKSQSAAIELEKMLCDGMATYLSCLEYALKSLCSDEVAGFQRTMTRLMIVQAFELTYCSSTFSQTDMSASFEGQGEALKVNELETALLVATATFVTCSHYIKHLRQV